MRSGAARTWIESKGRKRPLHIQTLQAPHLSPSSLRLGSRNKSGPPLIINAFHTRHYFFRPVSVLKKKNVQKEKSLCASQGSGRFSFLLILLASYLPQPAGQTALLCTFRSSDPSVDGIHLALFPLRFFSPSLPLFGLSRRSLLLLATVITDKHYYRKMVSAEA